MMKNHVDLNVGEQDRMASEDNGDFWLPAPSAIVETMYSGERPYYTMHAQGYDIPIPRLTFEWQVNVKRTDMDSFSGWMPLKETQFYRPSSGFAKFRARAWVDAKCSDWTVGRLMNFGPYRTDDGAGCNEKADPLSGVAIKLVDKPYGTPVAKLLVDAAAELHRNGFGGKVANGPTWSSEAIYAETAEDGIVGVICFTIQTWRGELWIEMGYVDPRFRGCGVYTKMYKTLEREAVKRNLRSIAGGVDPGNTAIIKAAERQGRKLEALTYRKWLEFDGVSVEMTPVKVTAAEGEANV